MTTDNVLVSREWLNALVSYVKSDAMYLYDEDYPKEIAQKFLAMPHYIESERDVGVVKNKMFTALALAKRKDRLNAVAQAAINALAYRKEGE